MASLGDVFLRVLADAAGFEASVVKEAGPGADKAGATIGKRMSQNMGKAMASTVRGLIGGAAGLMGGAILNQSRELDSATRQLIADTGMVGEEAAKAQGALTDLYRGNLQGYDQIAATMSKVHNDLGLTGDAANAASAAFLKFETATGQDAEAVSAFDDILDAWNKTAGDAAPLMDQLIVSHQKYGGSIAENEQALATMAPQLQALGVGLDGGIALLNLFAASGLDASKATFALNTAVKNLKPGQTLDDLIAQIAAIPDPTERAQKAIEIFGARGGVGLANALRPGVTGLSDFAVSADEAAGSTERAADTIEGGFGNRVQMAIKNVTGALADLGTQFGPLIYAAAALGPGLTKALGSAAGSIAGALGPAIGRELGIGVAKAAVASEAAGVAAGQATVAATAGPAAATAGTTLGGAMGKAASLAFKAALVLAPALLALDYVGAQSSNVDAINKVWKEAGTASLDALKAMREDLAARLKVERDRFDPIEDFFGLSQQSNLEKQLAGLDALIEQRGKEMPEALASGIEAGTPAVTDAATTAANQLPKAAKKTLAEIHTAGADSAKSLADGITSARQKPVDAFDQLVEMLKHPMTKTQEVARLMGELTSKELVAGLHSSDPAIRAQAQATKETILARLQEMKVGTGILSKDAAKELEKGLKSKDPQIRAAAQEVKKLIEGNIKPDGKATATGFLGSLAQWLVSPEGKGMLMGALGILATWLRTGIVAPTGGGTKPKPKSGGTTVPGKDERVALASGIRNVPYNNLPAVLHRGEAVLTAAEAEAWRTGAGNTYQVNVAGLLRARDPFEVAQQLRRLSDFGVLTPRREPA